MTMSKARRRVSMKIGVIAGLCLGAVFAGFPVVWMLSTSLKPNGEVFQVPPRLITENFSFDAYWKILTDPTQLRFFLNSYIVALWVTALTLLVGILGRAEGATIAEIVAVTGLAATHRARRLRRGC